LLCVLPAEFRAQTTSVAACLRDGQLPEHRVAIMGSEWHFDRLGLGNSVASQQQMKRGKGYSQQHLFHHGVLSIGKRQKYGRLLQG
jgi:hypothetical protein